MAPCIRFEVDVLGESEVARERTRGLLALERRGLPSTSTCRNPARKTLILRRHYDSPTESSLTIKFRGAEAELLDRLVRSGLFATKSEAVRAALVKYGSDLGLLRAKDLWTAIDTSPRRRVRALQLLQDVKKAEDAA